MKKHGNKDKISYKRKDLTGQKFAKIQIIGFHEKRGKHVYWNAVCDCGKEFSISTTTFGKTQSCGCINKLDYGQSSFNLLITSYKFRAKYSDIKFELTDAEFEQLTEGNCYYCGIEPKQVITGKKLNGQYVYNGVDRVDSNIGYNHSNCVSACGDCNKAKLDNSFSDFLDWAERLANNLLEKGDISLDEKVYKKLEKL